MDPKWAKSNARREKREKYTPETRVGPGGRDQTLALIFGPGGLHAPPRMLRMTVYCERHASRLDQQKTCLFALNLAHLDI